MALELWTPRELYKIFKDDRLDAVPSHFLDTYFTGTLFSQDREILMADLPAADRRMAPFVLPTEQGKPIYRQLGETVRALTPAYIKPKDVVRPADARNPRISEILGAPLSLQQRFDMRVAEVVAYHKKKIRTTEAWMAARAFIDGQVTIKYERDQGTAYPEVTVSFGRAGNQTVDASGTPWSDVDYKILDDIELYANRMQNALYGGWPARVYLGASVVPWVRKNKQIIAELDTQRRGTAVDIPTGIIKGAGVANPLVYIGTVGNGIELWSYKDQVEQANGTMVDLLGAKDILMVAPGAEGVRAYGAIYDSKALGDGAALATDVFPKMFETDDPGELYIMHQSAPLPIPLYPNRTLKATVLA